MYPAITTLKRQTPTVQELDPFLSPIFLNYDAAHAGIQSRCPEAATGKDTLLPEVFTSFKRVAKSPSCPHLHNCFHFHFSTRPCGSERKGEPGQLWWGAVTAR